MTINLITETADLLRSVGLVKECEQVFLTNPAIVACVDSPEYIQVKVLNYFWRVQLSQFGKDSMQARYCLVDEADAKQWIKLFQDTVLPFIVEKNLPTIID